jgi:hypothetical protein
MKKFLLGIVLLGMAFVGRTQVQISEIYPDASGTQSEFFELYNSGTTDVNLGCYTFVSYTGSGFYVLTLPNVVLKPQQYFVGAFLGNGQTTFNITNQSGVTPDYSWGPTGDVKLYTPSGSGYTVSTPTMTNNTFLTNQYAVFLFSGTGAYVDGFQGNKANGNLPTAIRNSNPMTLTGTCTQTITWSTAGPTDSENASGGTSNGFADNVSNTCGWNKTPTAPGPTPGFPNTTGTSVAKSGYTLSGVSLSCGTLNYTLTITGPQGSTPIYLDIFYDNNKNQIVDVGDTKLGTTTTINASGSASIAVDPTKNVILSFRNAAGCVVAQRANIPMTGSLRTTQTISCDQLCQLIPHYRAASIRLYCVRSNNNLFFW